MGLCLERQKVCGGGSVSAAQYNSADGTLSLTSDSTPTLLSPEQLLTAGIKGIEQWKS